MSQFLFLLFFLSLTRNWSCPLLGIYSSRAAEVTSERPPGSDSISVDSLFVFVGVRLCSLSSFPAWPFRNFHGTEYHGYVCDIDSDEDESLRAVPIVFCRINRQDLHRFYDTANAVPDLRGKFFPSLWWPLFKSYVATIFGNCRNLKCLRLTLGQLRLDYRTM